jgi:hypothetical protein
MIITDMTVQEPNYVEVNHLLVLGKENPLLIRVSTDTTGRFYGARAEKNKTVSQIKDTGKS